MTNNFTSNTYRPLITDNLQPTTNFHLYNPRPCPNCGETIYGMPGGRDAHCFVCGFKDPCCGDA